MTESTVQTDRRSDPRIRSEQGPGAATTARLMLFQLVMTAAKTWRRLKGENQLPKVIEGVTAKNGSEATTNDAKHAA